MSKYLLLFFVLIPSFDIKACCRCVKADRPAQIYPQSIFSPAATGAATGIAFSPTGAAVRYVRDLADSGVISYPQAIDVASELNNTRFGAHQGDFARAVYTDTDLRKVTAQMSRLLFKESPTQADRELYARLEAEETKIRSEINSRFGLK